MKIFRKPCVSVSDVVSPANDKKFTLAKEKDLGFHESQYEYVRREYGYDYVPPSQYVPSRSPDSEDDSESDAVEEDYRAAAPVKIMEPPSDLSGSMDDGDVFVRKHLPKRSHAHLVVGNNRYGNKHRTAHPKRRSDMKPYQPSLPIMEEEEEGALIHRPSHVHQDRQNHQRLQPGAKKQPLERHDQGNRKKEPQKYEKHEKPNQYRQNRIPDRRPVEEDDGGYRSDRHRRTSGEVNVDRRDRQPATRGKREDHVNDDDIAIEPVQTAFSYNSNDSAEVLIEEKSRGSRYNSTRNKDGTPRGDGRHRMSNYKSREEEDDWGEGLTNVSENLRKQTKNRNFEAINAYSSASQLYSENAKTETRRNTSSLDDFDKPRYDRKNSMSNEIKQARDEEEFRCRTYQDETRDPSRRRSLKPSARESAPPLPNRHQKIQRHVVEKQTHDVTQERDGYEKKWDKQTEDRRQHRDPASYYSTPSGEVASDYAFSERKRPHLSHSAEKKTGSKGFLGRIRDSVRGQKKSSKIPPVSPVENLHLDEGFPKERRLPSKSSGLFEQIQPSVRSDVSFENRRGPNLYGGELLLPSPPRQEIMSYPRHESRSHGHHPDKRHSHRHGGHDGRNIPRRSRRSADPPVDDMASQRFQRDGSDFSEYYYADPRMDEEAYWEASSVEYSDQSPEKNYPSTLSHASSAVPFQSFRSETPALRANPDLRQRHLPLPQTRHYTHGYHPYQQSKLSTPNAIGADSGLTTTQPVKVLSVPNKPGQTTWAKQNVVYPTNNKGFKIGCY
jgi:hypothetical protein